MTPDELKHGQSLLAAATPRLGRGMTEDERSRAEAAIRFWLRTHAADLIAAARQAQDNAKDAARYRHIRKTGYNERWREYDTYIDAAIAAATPDKGV